MEFASFNYFNGQLTVHYFTDNLQVYALDGSERAVEKWHELSPENRQAIVLLESEIEKLADENDRKGAVIDELEKYGF